MTLFKCGVLLEQAMGMTDLHIHLVFKLLFHYLDVSLTAIVILIDHFPQNRAQDFVYILI